MMVVLCAPHPLSTYGYHTSLTLSSTTSGTGRRDGRAGRRRGGVSEGHPLSAGSVLHPPGLSLLLQALLHRLHVHCTHQCFSPQLPHLPSPRDP